MKLPNSTNLAFFSDIADDIYADSSFPCQSTERKQKPRHSRKSLWRISQSPNNEYEDEKCKSDWQSDQNPFQTIKKSNISGFSFRYSQNSPNKPFLERDPSDKKQLKSREPTRKNYTLEQQKFKTCSQPSEKRRERTQTSDLAPGETDEERQSQSCAYALKSREQSPEKQFSSKPSDSTAHFPLAKGKSTSTEYSSKNKKSESSRQTLDHCEKHISLGFREHPSEDEFYSQKPSDVKREELRNFNLTGNSIVTCSDILEMNQGTTSSEESSNRRCDGKRSSYKNRLLFIKPVDFKLDQHHEDIHRATNNSSERNLSNIFPECRRSGGEPTVNIDDGIRKISMLTRLSCGKRASKITLVTDDCRQNDIETDTTKNIDEVLNTSFESKCPRKINSQEYDYETSFTAESLASGKSMRYERSKRKLPMTDEKDQTEENGTGVKFIASRVSCGRGDTETKSLSDHFCKIELETTLAQVAKQVSDKFVACNRSMHLDIREDDTETDIPERLLTSNKSVECTRSSTRLIMMDENAQTEEIGAKVGLLTPKASYEGRASEIEWFSDDCCQADFEIILSGNPKEISNKSVECNRSGQLDNREEDTQINFPESLLTSSECKPSLRKLTMMDENAQTEENWSIVKSIISRSPSKSGAAKFKWFSEDCCQTDLETPDMQLPKDMSNKSVECKRSNQLDKREDDTQTDFSERHLTSSKSVECRQSSNKPVMLGDNIKSEKSCMGEQLVTPTTSSGNSDMNCYSLANCRQSRVVSTMSDNTQTDFVKIPPRLSKSLECKRSNRKPTMTDDNKLTRSVSLLSLIDSESKSVGTEVVLDDYCETDQEIRPTMTSMRCSNKSVERNCSKSIPYEQINVKCYVSSTKPSASSKNTEVEKPTVTEENILSQNNSTRNNSQYEENEKPTVMVNRCLNKSIECKLSRQVDAQDNNAQTDQTKSNRKLGMKNDGIQTENFSIRNTSLLSIITGRNRGTAKALFLDEYNQTDFDRRTILISKRCSHKLMEHKSSRQIDTSDKNTIMTFSTRPSTLSKSIECKRSSRRAAVRDENIQTDNVSNRSISILSMVTFESRETGRELLLDEYNQTDIHVRPSVIPKKTSNKSTECNLSRQVNTRDDNAQSSSFDYYPTSGTSTQCTWSSIKSNRNDEQIITKNQDKKINVVSNQFSSELVEGERSAYNQHDNDETCISKTSSTSIFTRERKSPNRMITLMTDNVQTEDISSTVDSISPGTKSSDPHQNNSKETIPSTPMRISNKSLGHEKSKQIDNFGEMKQKAFAEKPLISNESIDNNRSNRKQTIADYNVETSINPAGSKSVPSTSLSASVAKRIHLYSDDCCQTDSDITATGIVKRLSNKSVECVQSRQYNNIEETTQTNFLWKPLKLNQSTECNWSSTKTVMADDCVQTENERPKSKYVSPAVSCVSTVSNRESIKDNCCQTNSEILTTKTSQRVSNRFVEDLKLRQYDNVEERTKRADTTFQTRSKSMPSAALCGISGLRKVLLIDHSCQTDSEMSTTKIPQRAINKYVECMTSRQDDNIEEITQTDIITKPLMLSKSIECNRSSGKSIMVDDKNCRIVNRKSIIDNCCQTDSIISRTNIPNEVCNKSIECKRSQAQTQDNSAQAYSRYNSHGEESNMFRSFQSENRMLSKSLEACPPVKSISVQTNEVIVTDENLQTDNTLEFQRFGSAYVDKVPLAVPPPQKSPSEVKKNTGAAKLVSRIPTLTSRNSRNNSIGCGQTKPEGDIKKKAQNNFMQDGFMEMEPRRNALSSNKSPTFHKKTEIQNVDYEDKTGALRKKDEIIKKLIEEIEALRNLRYDYDNCVSHNRDLELRLVNLEQKLKKTAAEQNETLKGKNRLKMSCDDCASNEHKEDTLNYDLAGIEMLITTFKDKLQELEEEICKKNIIILSLENCVDKSNEILGDCEKEIRKIVLQNESLRARNDHLEITFRSSNQNNNLENIQNKITELVKEYNELLREAKEKDAELEKIKRKYDKLCSLVGNTDKNVRNTSVNTEVSNRPKGDKYGEKKHSRKKKPLKKTSDTEPPKKKKKKCTCKDKTICATKKCGCDMTQASVTKSQKEIGRISNQSTPNDNLQKEKCRIKTTKIKPNSVGTCDCWKHMKSKLKDIDTGKTNSSMSFIDLMRKYSSRTNSINIDSPSNKSEDIELRKKDESIKRLNNEKTNLQLKLNSMRYDLNNMLKEQADLKSGITCLLNEIITKLRILTDSKDMKLTQTGPTTVANEVLESLTQLEKTLSSKKSCNCMSVIRSKYPLDQHGIARQIYLPLFNKFFCDHSSESRSNASSVEFFDITELEVEKDVNT